jgi:uncharacterized protein YndB with AHSA1/START domain
VVRDEYAFTVESSVAIDASADAVYALVSDVTRMGEWSPECVGGEWVDDDRRGAGARFLGHNRVGRRAWTTECEVLVADPPREFTWHVLTLVVVPETSIWRFTLEPSGAGVVLTEAFEMTAAPTGLRRVLESIPEHQRSWALSVRKDELQLGIEQTLAAIAATAEGR